MRAATITAWISETATAVRAESDHLTQLDAAIGDGDHGTNMTRGFDAVEKAPLDAEHCNARGTAHVLEAARRTGVAHQSPQAFVVRDGKTVWDASHFDITAEAVEAAVTENK